MVISQRNGLVINISSTGATERIGAILPYGVAIQGLDRMSAGMAIEFRRYRISVISLWPSPTSAKAMLDVTDQGDWSSLSSPEFTGRVVAALAEDGQAGLKSGKSLRLRDLAKEFHIADERNTDA